MRNRVKISDRQTTLSKTTCLPDTTPYPTAFAESVNRRAFFKTSSALFLLLAASSGVTLTSEQQLSPESPQPFAESTYFSKDQRQVLDAVQMLLFPDDGNGPSARDINAIAYLDYAMTDPDNINDGDPSFIANGIGWLNDLCQRTYSTQFIRLSVAQQENMLQKIATSNAGENWLSLLMYYLTEALMLDPIYGGNPKQIGWQWLQHQPGFPRPVTGKTYRDFE